MEEIKSYAIHLMNSIEDKIKKGEIDIIESRVYKSGGQKYMELEFEDKEGGFGEE